MEEPNIKEDLILSFGGCEYVLAPWNNYLKDGFGSDIFSSIRSNIAIGALSLFDSVSQDAVILHKMTPVIDNKISETTCWWPAFCGSLFFLKEVFENTYSYKNVAAYSLTEAKQNVDDFLIRVNNLKMFL